MTLQADWGQRLEAVQHVLALSEAAYQAAVSARDAFATEIRGAGFTQAQTAALLGISNQRVSQIERAGWKGGALSSAADRLETARAAFQAAKHAQKLREENYAMGYRAETRGFYGDLAVAPAEDPEQRIGWAGWHQAREAAS